MVVVIVVISQEVPDRPWLVVVGLAPKVGLSLPEVNPNQLSPLARHTAAATVAATTIAIPTTIGIAATATAAAAAAAADAAAFLFSRVGQWPVQQSSVEDHDGASLGLDEVGLAQRR
jgi:hypothetical protein